HALRAGAVRGAPLTSGKQQPLAVRRSADDLPPVRWLRAAGTEAEADIRAGDSLQPVRVSAQDREEGRMSTRGGKLLSLILAGACAVLFVLAVALQVGLGRGYSWLQPEADTGVVSAGSI